MDTSRVSDEEFERIKNYIGEYKYIDLVKWVIEIIKSGYTKNNRLYTLIDGEISRRNKAKEKTEEDIEEVKNYFARYSYLDLIMWRNDMIDGGNINNHLFVLIDHEIMRRNAERYSSMKEGKSK